MYDEMDIIFRIYSWSNFHVCVSVCVCVWCKCCFILYRYRVRPTNRPTDRPTTRLYTLQSYSVPVTFWARRAFVLVVAIYLYSPPKATSFYRFIVRRKTDTEAGSYSFSFCLWSIQLLHRCRRFYPSHTRTSTYTEITITHSTAYYLQ